MKQNPWKSITIISIIISGSISGYSLYQNNHDQHSADTFLGRAWHETTETIKDAADIAQKHPLATVATGVGFAVAGSVVWDLTQKESRIIHLATSWYHKITQKKIESCPSI